MPDLFRRPTLTRDVLALGQQTPIELARVPSLEGINQTAAEAMSVPEVQKRTLAQPGQVPLEQFANEFSLAMRDGPEAVTKNRILESQMREQEFQRQLSLVNQGSEVVRQAFQNQYKLASERRQERLTALRYEHEKRLAEDEAKRQVAREKQDAALTTLQAANAALARARTEAVNAGIDPNSAVFKQKERTIQAKIDQAEESLGIRQESLELQREALNLRTPEGKARTAQALNASNMRVQFGSMEQILNAAEKRGNMTGPESMALLAGHMAMTVGTIKGARTGKELIQAHITARSLPQTMEALGNRIVNGGVLSMEQAREFVSLARMRLKELEKEAGHGSVRTGEETRQYQGHTYRRSKPNDPWTLIQ